MLAIRRPRFLVKLAITLGLGSGIPEFASFRLVRHRERVIERTPVFFLLFCFKFDSFYGPEGFVTRVDNEGGATRVDRAKEEKRGRIKFTADPGERAVC